MQATVPSSQVKFDQNKIRLGKFQVKSNFTYMSETPGQALKRLRIAAGLNQTDLAERSRVSKNYISLLEADKVSQPRTYQIEKIEKALNLPKGHLQQRLAGLSFEKPSNLPELLEALEGLGIEIEWATVKNNFDGYTPDDFEDLKEQIAANVGVKIRRVINKKDN